MKNLLNLVQFAFNPRPKSRHKKKETPFQNSNNKQIYSEVRVSEKKIDNEERAVKKASKPCSEIHNFMSKFIFEAKIDCSAR